MDSTATCVVPIYPSETGWDPDRIADAATHTGLDKTRESSKIGLVSRTTAAEVRLRFHVGLAFVVH